MTGYVARRLAQAVPTVIGLTLVVFVLVRLTGDPAAVMLPPDAPASALAAMRHQLGLDQPLPVQYLRFLEGLVRGDFGVSLRYRTPVLDLILSRLPLTGALALASLALSLAVGVPLGMLAGLRPHGWLDHGIRVLALAGQAFPTFYLGLILIIVLAVWLRVLPPGGSGSVAQLILPAVTLAMFLMPVVLRFMRGAMLEVAGQDWVRTARAKGMGERRVVGVHMVKNAMIPVVTIVGLQVGSVLSGAVVTETVFAWPGLGRLLVDAIATRDFPVVEGSVVVIALIFILVSLLVDLSYAWLDPRIRLR